MARSLALVAVLLPALGAVPSAGADPARAACAAMVRILAETGWAASERSEAPVRDPKTGDERPGCLLTLSVVTNDLDEPWPDLTLRSRMVRDGWEDVLEYAADGPGTTAYALRRDAVICYVEAGAPSWLDDDGKTAVADRYRFQAGCVRDRLATAGEPDRGPEGTETR